MRAIVEDVLTEIGRVDAKRGLDLATAWGSGPQWFDNAKLARMAYDRLEAMGSPDFANALREEVYEAMAESDPTRLRAELVQVASLAIRWIRAIDARS